MLLSTRISSSQGLDTPGFYLGIKRLLLFQMCKTLLYLFFLIISSELGTVSFELLNLLCFKILNIYNVILYIFSVYDG
uniref:Uncharacterized protein n=1 Tax=Rhizophora mucronata TaxID=61149 RepID=A0A2P2JUM8_RHIMU